MFWVKESTELDRLEIAEIERLKWLESERRGHDIGQYYAEWLWLTRHRAGWLASVTGQAHQHSGTHVQ